MLHWRCEALLFHTRKKAQQKCQLSGSLGIRVNRRERERQRKKEASQEATRYNKAKTQLKVKECKICLPEIEYLTKHG